MQSPMNEPRKRFVLLDAYEALTEKETFCINEANFEEISRVQAKKSKLLAELESLSDTPLLDEKEISEFNQRIDTLRERETSNSLRLDGLMKENREQFRDLSKRANSASQIRRAYGSASNPAAPNRSLKNKA